MINNPLISIIIPVYNVEKYLKECLDSVINQSYKNLEIIVVDDGSTDKSGEICDEFALKDNRIKVIHQKNGGVSSARNKGLDSTRGEFITFIDSDDTVERKHIQNMINLLKSDIDIVCVALVENLSDLMEYEFDGIKALKYILYEKESWFGWSNFNKLFKADIVKDIRYLSDEKVGEDFSFSWKAFLNSKKVAFGNMVTYNYRVSETSVMRSNFDERHQTLLLVCDRFIEYVKNHNADLLQEAYYFKATRLIALVYYARENDKNNFFTEKYSKELKKIQIQIYKNKNVNFKFKFLCFLHSYFYKILSYRNKIRKGI